MESALTDPNNGVPEPGGYRNRPVSWVRRGVRMTDGQAAAWQQHGTKYLVEPPRSVSRESIAPGWVLDPSTLFTSEPGNIGPQLMPDAAAAIPAGENVPGVAAQTSQSKLVIEIGTGRGENIVSAAAREPQTNFLGVEVYGPGLARAILLAESAGTGHPVPHLGPGIAQAIAGAEVPSGQGLANLRLIQADAPELLDALPSGQVDEIWVFFPDPWPKTKHFKRRMIDADFTAQIARVLKPGGVIRLATDWAHYAEQMAEVFAAASSQFEPLPTNAQNQRFAGRVLTAFESKGLREGRAVTDLGYRRR